MAHIHPICGCGCDGAHGFVAYACRTCQERDAENERLRQEIKVLRDQQEAQVSSVPGGLTNSMNRKHYHDEEVKGPKLGYVRLCPECGRREALIERLRSEIQALRAQQEAQAQYSMIHEEEEH